MNVPARFIAIDWSGNARASGQRRHIWTADISRTLVRLVHGKTREELCSWLIEQVLSDPTPTVIGIDFAFSLPMSFLKHRNYSDVRQLWRMAEIEGPTWLQSCPPPFWGRPGKQRPKSNKEEGFRLTDQAFCINGISPKSPYQIGGAGAVGTGSIRGFPFLAKLRSEGFSVWPFYSTGFPLVVEIYPRLLTGPVNKSQQPARINYLSAQKFDDLPPDVRACAEQSEDAFDALVSALCMRDQAQSFAALTQTQNPRELLKGTIWRPCAQGMT